MGHLRGLDWRRSGGVMLAMLGFWGCTQMLGIEEAHVDPSLDSVDQLQESTTTDGPGASTTSGNNATNGNGAGGSINSDTGTTGEAGATPTDDGGSGGSTTSATSSNTTGGGTGSEPPQTLCDSYCDDMMEACTGARAQYRDRAQCLKICEMLPEGTLGKVNENTVACRAKYVGDARYSNGTELDAYCRRAGPGGAGFCGSNCDGYCTLMMQVCSGSDVGVYQFASESDCLDVCEGLPSAETGYSISNPEIADGNHVECRLFHVASAAMLDPEEHCEHAMGVTLCEAPTEE